MTTQSKTLEHAIAAIEALDLEPIKFKATRQEDGYGWSAAYADQVENAYRRYLILHAKYPELQLAPDQDTDRFWHMHILDTRKYAQDCERIFGHFLHHYPYLGLRGADDARALEEAFATMQNLLAKEFGTSAPQTNADRANDVAAWCGLEPGKAAAAWCGLEPGKPSTAAWCGLEPNKPAVAAWCGLEPGRPVVAAWCGIEPGAKPSARRATAAAL